MTNSQRDTESAQRTAADALAANAASLCEATRLAWQWHGRQTRKGKPSPYLSHLLQVQGLVIDHGGDTEQAIAALLHDALEDAESPDERAQRESEIGARFGSGVVRIVLDCTDTTPEEAGLRKGPWRVRKQRYIAQLASAPASSLLVPACDKHHNLSDLIGDLRHEGTGSFSRFNAGPTEQLWYFESLIEIFRPSVPPRLASDLEGLLSELDRFVHADPPLRNPSIETS
ncbi:MAG: HD domain-containing protein [Deltaproteobacteria bacterium]|nr:HD domain-containing protein [Deltaproteobacteria bacterium]